MNNPGILISNSFPFSLIRRRVAAEPRSVEEMLAVMFERPWTSIWGHPNTARLASTILCADIRPPAERPALTLNAENLPHLNGQTFDECWLLSPDYANAGFRPAVGEEVKEEEIRGWQVVKLVWE